MSPNVKICSRCKLPKPTSDFGKHTRSRDGYQWWCNKCKADWMLQKSHASGKRRPLNQAIDSASYLGVHIAEKVLSQYFEDVKRTPYGYPGYDFICKNGYKIDVKSSCTRRPEGRHNRWTFIINKNKTSDYFFCIAFDDRKSLNPVHVWLIPGSTINDKYGITITDVEKSLHKYAGYEKSINKIFSICNSMRCVA
jgi:hypothetical protein